MTTTDPSGSRLLLVDDSRADAYLVKLLAGGLAPDLEVEVAKSGEAALHRLEDAGDGELPDLVLLDLDLPRLSGHDVLAALHARVPPTELPVVIFSSSSDERDRTRSLELGATDHVTKPGDLREFESVMAELLARFFPAPARALA